VAELLRAVEIAGAWETGIESDRKGRGSSLNVDVYGYDERRQLAVVQVRQCIFRPGRFKRVRKDYYLIGRNENGNAFAHPVEATARPLSLRSPEEAVLYILARVWDCAQEDVDDIKRNGDVAFVPVGTLPEGAELLEQGYAVVRESHHVMALAGGKVYRMPLCGKAVGAPVLASGWVAHAHTDACRWVYYVAGRAKIEHSKRQHPTARVRGGVWRVQAAERGSVWGFTAPTAD
jgi:hypothetical protein